MSGHDDLSIWLDSWLSQQGSEPEASWEWDFRITDEPGDVDSRDSHWHRAHWRETAPASRVAVLDLLLDAFPGGMTTLQFVDAGHPRAQARIHELTLDGWSITTTEGHDGTAMYTLASRSQGKPTMGRVSALRVYRHPSGRVEVEGLKPRRGPDTDTWDQEQVERDIAAVRAALCGTVED